METVLLELRYLVSVLVAVILGFAIGYESLLLGATVPAFAACADNTPNGNAPSGGNEQAAEEPEAPADPGEGDSPAEPEAPDDPGTPDTDSNILIVYFSAQGHTEAVAGYIARATGGDLFELVPADPYTAEDLRWTDENSRVVQEYENPELRDTELVSATVANWAEYDVVFIGYPIWWGIAAWPVNGFAEANDFMGKNVVPFCTSASSGLGDSGSLLADMAGEGNWLTGHRFRSSASENDVRDWLEDIGAI